MLFRSVAAYCANPLLRTAHGAAGERRSRDFAWDAINSAVADAYIRLVSRSQDRVSA